MELKKHHYRFIPIRRGVRFNRLYFVENTQYPSDRLHELEDDPTEWQPGSGFYNWYMDTSGRVEYLRLVLEGKPGDEDRKWRFDPPAEYLDPKKLCAFFYEDSKEMDAIIRYHREKSETEAKKKGE